MKSIPKLFLASKSPRRRELLQQIGVEFQVLDVSVPEQRETHETAEDYVVRLAREKARAGVQQVESGCVLGADTVVVLASDVLEKPLNEHDGLAMLARLSGTFHHVLTGVAVAQADRIEVSVVATKVYFRPIATAEARRYWLSGEPKDKAGGYGIQGLGAVFVTHLEGCYSNVVGLPLQETHRLLSLFDIPVWCAEAPYER